MVAFISALITASLLANAPVPFPALHERHSALPPLRTNRAEVRRLAEDVFRIASTLRPIDDVVVGVPCLSLYATATDGRRFSAFQARGTGVLDSLDARLGPGVRLTYFNLQYLDCREYQNRGVLLNQSRVESAWLTLSASGERNRSSYGVSGYDLPLVDSLARRITTFTDASRTWRGDQAGLYAQTIMRALALVLMPLAMARRDRRFSWALWALSGLLLVGGFVFPIRLILNSVMIAAG